MLDARHLVVVAFCLLSLCWGEIAGTSNPADPPQAVLGGFPTAPRFSGRWKVLGPFQIGTREAAWGSDPLEYYGGFPSIKYDPSASFKSALGVNGSVTWSEIGARSTDPTDLCRGGCRQISLLLEFPDIDWEFLQSTYGWSAKQYQAWVRGTIRVGAGRLDTVLLYTDQILEYAIDGVRHWGGDFYSYRRAPHVLQLQPGVHTIDVRVVRDIRAMGGVGEPTTTVRLELAGSQGSLEIVKSNVLVSDVVDGDFSSPYVSIPLRNSAIEWLKVESVDISERRVYQADSQPDPYTVAPGQTRPLVVRVDLGRGHDSNLAIKVTYSTTPRATGFLSSASVTVPLRHRSRYEAHKLTFLHPSGIVSYAVLRPPATGASCQRARGFRAPVLLSLHGAGVEADSDQVRHSLDAVADLCAWVLFPSGVTSWSGDDWHTWGFSDVQAAVQALPGWVERLDWKGPDVDIERWIVSGHSNGGQGTWYILTHHPDKVLAAAPVSGYSSISQYVPFQFWHQADPAILAVIQSSLNSYRHELLIPNSNGIPILQQHGEADDNVPVYHSRLMAQLLAEANWTSHYVELPGQSHWFDGIMTTPVLRDFYRASAALERRSTALQQFRVVSANPGDTGPKQGVLIRRLEEPGRIGWVDVAVQHFDADTCFLELTTRNVKEIGVQYDACGVRRVRIDGLEVAVETAEGVREWTIAKENKGPWMASSSPQTTTSLRSARQMGGFDAILRTTGRFTVTYTDFITRAAAQQIARNLYQYFAADSQIVEYRASILSSTPGNVIWTSLGRQALLNPDRRSPISVRRDGLHLRRAGYDEVFGFDEVSGAVFVRPLSEDRLALVVWGFNKAGLAAAARVVPLLTGVGSPDFVVLSKSMAWEGVAGIRAMGYFDDEWQVAERSTYV